MPDNEELRDNIRNLIFGAGGLSGLLSANISDDLAPFEQTILNEIERMRRAGISDDVIRTIIAADLRDGSFRLFGPLQTKIRAQMDMGIAMAAEIGKNTYLESEGVALTMWTWQTTTSSTGPCQNCGPRAGQTKSYAEWEIAGLPRSGFSVCGSRCLCFLNPAGVDAPATVVI